ncbi:MAG: hypothetical protein ABEH47_03160 [Haloferacaceae archaeon]
MAQLGDRERNALHEVQLGVEHLHRAYGHLLAFHHAVGHAMDRFAAIEDDLRAVGYDEYASELRDDHLPAGVVGDRWSYELVEEFQDGFLAEMTGFEHRLREDVAGGRRHVTEREQQRRWRERARR